MEMYRGKSQKGSEWIVGSAVFLEDRVFMLTSPNLLPERPSYSGIAVGCGLEDNYITDRYEAAAYGWQQALEKYEENFPIWVELIPKTVTRCSRMADVLENVLFEGDVYRNPDNVLFEICYGQYMAWCPADRCYMENMGFFAVSQDVHDQNGSILPMPLGKTSEYAYLVGNIFDTPKLKQIPDWDELCGIKR